MICYHYHPITFGYLGSEEADESPLEPGVFLLPADATFVPLPTFEIGVEYLVFDIDNNEWIVKTIPAPDPIPETTFEEAKADKIKEIRATGAAKLDQIANPYTLPEQITWSTQLEEAKAYLVDNTATTPLIDQLATYRGVSKADLVSKIMENANAFRSASGMVLGIQQKLLDQIGLATTKEELELIVWPT